MPTTIDPMALAHNLQQAAAFVDWINSQDEFTGSGDSRTEGRIPSGYRWSLDTPGRKVVRIVMHTPGDSRSVHAFVDLATGDLLKAAGWKAPAKGPRGNIATEDGLQDVKDRFTWSGGYLYLK